MAQKFLTNFTPPGTSDLYKFRAGALFYGTTSNSTTAMTVSIPGVTEYYTGLTLILKMGAQAASGCTLNVNSLGAKAMKYGANSVGTYFTSGATYLFVYDGTDFKAVHSYNSNTTYSNMTGATTSAAGKAGLVPAPAAGEEDEFLRGDGTWAVPTNTNTKMRVYRQTSGYDGNYPLLVSRSLASAIGTAGTNDSQTAVYGVFRENTDGNAMLLANPAKGTITAPGGFIGNASTATNVAWTGVTGKPSYYDAKAIKSITRSGTTFTYTCLDGTTGTFTQQDNNTTYSAEKGITLSSGKFGHTNSITEKTTYNQNTASPGYGGTFKITEPKYDAYGHITGVQVATITMPNAITASDLGLSNALHFRGVVTSLPSTTSGYVNGDVILVNKKEYVCSNSTWVELGDESSFSLKDHTHNYAGSSSAGGAATSANKVNSSLSIQLNGGTATVFDGSAAKSINITPAAIGAAASSHGTHVSYGTSAAAVGTTSSAGTASTVSRSDHVHNLTKATVVAALGYTPPTSNTTYSAGAGLTLDGTTFKHSNSVTAATASGSATKTLTFGGTFALPTVSYDAQGHVTGSGTTTMTMPSDRLFVTLVPTGTTIPANANLNTPTYMKVGRYFCSQTANAKTLQNCPVDVAFMMEVYSPLSTTIDNETTGTWVYRIRKITAYNTGMQFIQYASVGATANTWTYGAWKVQPIANFTLDTTDNNGGSALTGSATNPIYLKADGTFAACTYSLNKSVPSDAKFTDTVYTHPTTSGNKHIPSGGSSGQILRWSADGTATWGADNNTNYYHTPAYTTGLKIGTGTGVSDMYVPSATGSQSGVVMMHPAANCTTFTSDDSTCTVAAVKKAVTLFTNDYAPTKTGGGASGTWGINITGNAATATKLTTDAGGTTTPVYFSGGVPKVCTMIKSGAWHGGLTYIGGDGVMEVGRYIDFHVDKTGTSDYDVRITASTAGLSIGGTTSGTFKGNLDGNASSATKATQDGSGNVITSKYVTLDTAQTISGTKTMTGSLKVSGRYAGSGDDEGIIVGFANNGYAGLCLGGPSEARSVFYFKSDGTKPFWRYNNGTTGYDISHPEKSGIIALTSDIPTSMAWSSITGKPSTFTPSSHTHDYIAAKGNYTFNASTLPNSFDLGVSAGFVSNDSGFGNYGSVLTARTYSGGGGTLQLYAPYSPTYGGTRLKARFGNYDSGNGNSWTDLKELAWTSDLTWNNISGKPSAFNPDLPLRLKNYSTSGYASVDDATEQGFHYITGATSRPSFSTTNATDYRVLTTAYSNAWLQQIATDFRCNDIFYRRKENGTWKSWVQIQTTESADARYVKKSGDTMTGLLGITTNGKSTTFGCQNSSYSHYSTTADVGHWFNKNTYVQGNIYAGSSYNKLVLTEENYTNYAPTKTGGGASGTWGISITGNAATATTSSNSNWLNTNSTLQYGASGLNYFNISGTAGSAANANETPTADWYHIIRMNHANSNGYYTDIASCFHNNNMYMKRVASGSSSGWLHIWVEGNSVTSAVWNDYAECRESDCEEFGYVLMEVGDDSLTKTTERLSHFAGVSSDTWGFSQGETDKAKTPIAVAGRVLVYPYQDRNNYKPGDCVCAAPGGTVDIMTREEVREWPDRIVGTVSCVPDYEEWGGGEGADRDPVKVNGRIWIKVK